jgi:hypothetical protein
MLSIKTPSAMPLREYTPELEFSQGDRTIYMYQHLSYRKCASSPLREPLLTASLSLVQPFTRGGIGTSGMRGWPCCRRESPC